MSNINFKQMLLDFQDFKIMDAKVAEHKSTMRDYADGETLEEVVPGIGKITVKKPSPASSKEVLVFSEEKFNLLDNATKALLTKAGVVEAKTVSSSGSVAAVTFTLNV